MIIVVAFDIKNYVEVMEGWPIEINNVRLFLEREGDVLKRVCVAFAGVDIIHAPTFKKKTAIEHAHLSIKGEEYAAEARGKILNWQAVVCGLQIIDIDFDNYELRFSPESTGEEDKIAIRSFKPGSTKALNAACDFEQIGRAFCVEQISDDRIESTSHFREGRLAYEAGRYVDAYNSLFLFLETRFCEGRTKTKEQVNLLSKRQDVIAAVNNALSEFKNGERQVIGRKLDLIDLNDSDVERIRKLVLLRGKLRHHSLKSPARWNPNQQDEYEGAARFMSMVVGDIVIKETLSDLYSPNALERFRALSIQSGNETNVALVTGRIEKLPSISLDMSFPTTVISSKLCLASVQNAIDECVKGNQLTDTVRLEGVHGRSGLELVSAELGTWAYTPNRVISSQHAISSVYCVFEHFRQNTIMQHDFYVPFGKEIFSILNAWELFKFSVDHIERRDPTTRIMTLKLYVKKGTRPLLTYRVGAQVRN